MSVEWDGDKYRGEVVPPEIRPDHMEPVDLDNRVFFDMTAVAPAPSRDFYRLRVTNSEVEFTCWKISHGASRSMPLRTTADLQKITQDSNLSSEIVRVFGQSYLDYIIGLSQGKLDWLLTLPNSILVKIIEMVGIDSLHYVAPVCQRFRQICEGDQLWYKFFDHYAPKNESLRKQALSQSKFFPWRTIFLFHRVQDVALGFGKFKLGEPYNANEKGNVKRLSDTLLVKRNQKPLFPPRLIPLPMSESQESMLSMMKASEESMSASSIPPPTEENDQERKITELRDSRRMLTTYMHRFVGDAAAASPSSTTLIAEPIQPNDFFDKMYPSGYDFYK